MGASTEKANASSLRGAGSEESGDEPQLSSGEALLLSRASCHSPYISVTISKGSPRSADGGLKAKGERVALAGPAGSRTGCIEAFSSTCEVIGPEAQQKEKADSALGHEPDQAFANFIV